MGTGTSRPNGEEATGSNREKADNVSEGGGNENQIKIKKI